MLPIVTFRYIATVCGKRNSKGKRTDIEVTSLLYARVFSNSLKEAIEN